MSKNRKDLTEVEIYHGHILAERQLTKLKSEKTKLLDKLTQVDHEISLYSAQLSLCRVLQKEKTDERKRQRGETQ